MYLLTLHTNEILCHDELLACKWPTVRI